MKLVEMLAQAHPHLDRALVEEAVAELRGFWSAQGLPADQALRDENEDLKASLGDHRKEIVRLNTMLVNQRAGLENASPQVMAIVAERGRQKLDEGYSESHDDEHSNFELSKAAAAYMSDAILRAGGHEGHREPPPIFPWKVTEWKRKPVMRQMEIAMTLFVAEMERLARNGIEV